MEKSFDQLMINYANETMQDFRMKKVTKDISVLEPNDVTGMISF